MSNNAFIPEMPVNTGPPSPYANISDVPMPTPFFAEPVFGDRNGDQTKLVTFYAKAVVNVQKSREAGRQIKEDVIFITMQDPGDNLLIIDRPAKDYDKARFPRQWQLFSAGYGGLQEGMDLNLIFPIEPSIVEHLKSKGIHTIEQLSAVQDIGLQNIGMGAVQWQQKAKRYLEQAKDAASMNRLNHELEKRDEVIDALRVQLQTLTEAMNRFGQAQPEQIMNAPPKRGPGRPRKEPVDTAPEPDTGE